MWPSLGTDRISLCIWLNISFVVNHQGTFRLIITFAINLLTSEDRYFLWITAVSLLQRCLQSWQHSGSRMHRVTLGLSGPRVGSSLFDFLTVPSTHYVPKNYIYLQSDLSCLWKFNCNLFNHNERLDFFSLYRPAPAIRHFSGWLW